MTPLFSGAVLVALGRSTCAADSIVTEVVTMKMISRTRKISVSGVILMSAKTPPPPPLMWSANCHATVSPGAQRRSDDRR